jgi:mono/diheme cytochrome c family protein
MSPKAHGLIIPLTGLLLAALLLILSAQVAWTAPPAQSVADGQALFQSLCTACHTIGGGTLVGPDLKDVTKRADPQWLASFIAAPNNLIAAGDPTATALVKQYNNVQMPNLGLTQAQVASLIAYLEAPGGVVTQTTAATLPAGDPAKGEALFLGSIHLQNGGPPCMSCHSIDDAGLLGGGTVGPNLTGAYGKYGAAGLASALANIPFPAMKPIFTDDPLTAQEQADLYAYIQSVAGQPQTNRLVPFLALSLAGWIGLMIVIGIVWRNRLRAVREKLVGRGPRPRAVRRML